MTKKLFYDDPYLRRFSARVTGCAPEKGKWAVTLDATAFYPEGGGQPGDTGTLGGVRVTDTRGRDKEVVHITESPLEPGMEVEGVIDWEARFSRMQHHSGEHIVSGIIHRMYGFDNVGFHMGRDAVTIDVSGELTEEQTAAVERKANEAVWRNLPVEIAYPSAGELERLEYRSKKALTGEVRIVTVPGCDVCACCGTHVRMTGEIGLIKLVNAQRYKGGVRVWLLCGDRALEDYGKKNGDVFAVSSLLSAKPHEITGAVERILAERDGLKLELSQIQESLFRLKAAGVESGPVTVQFEEGLSPVALRRYCAALCERCTVSAVMSGSGREWKYALGSLTADVRPIGKRLNERFAGRGGGKADLVQGSLTAAREELETFIASEAAACYAQEK